MNQSEHDLIKLIAFFLPQFHPTPENDLWWGTGFTEWTNVTKATPNFVGHYQPHLPTDSGFYDLRVKETRLKQIEMAKGHGIAGFCYHYYWFSGTRILNEPVDAMLADKDHDMPFCLCWANENWTRQWDAAEHEILIAQKYAPEDNLNFIKSLVPFFQDERYIRLNGKPFVIVYRPQHLPDSKKSIEIWRKYCHEVGVGDIHVCCALTHGNMDHVSFGFDSGVEFPPHNLGGISGYVDKNSLDFLTDFTGNVVQYSAIANLFLNRDYPGLNVFKGVFPSWDNTARRGPRAFTVLNGTPSNYEYWLKESVTQTAERYPGQERFVFINAWNEWAEGCHLEPDRIYGRGFLDATLRVRQGISQTSQFSDVGLPEGETSFFESLLAECNSYSPEILSPECFWLSHLPFTHWLVNNQKPANVVIVNADTGNAPLNIAKSVKHHRKDAVVQCSVRQHTETTITLVERSAGALSLSVTPESAFVSGIAPGSVDLLVFDDFVSPTELESSFSIALEKMSPQGIMIFHDIFVGDNPMYKFWDSIKSRFPSFTFEKSHGLGILLVGKNTNPIFHKLVDSDVANSDWNVANLLFGVMGSRISASAETRTVLDSLNAVQFKLSNTERTLVTTQRAYEEVTNSSSWKVTAPLRQILTKIR
jgi:hypothetical protein